MPTIIAKSWAGKVEYIPGETAARKILSDLKLQITKPDGTIKSGVLCLRHTDRRSRNDMSFERKGWWQFCARKSDKMEITAHYLKVIFRQAYRPTKDTRQHLAYTRVMDDFARYLQDRNNRIGTRTLHKYLVKLEESLTPAKNPVLEISTIAFPDPKYEVPVPADIWNSRQSGCADATEDALFKDICTSKSTDGEKEKIRKSLKLARSVVARVDGNDPQLQHLGSGQFGIAYSFLDQNNKRQVLKCMTGNITCSVGMDAAMRGPEVCAARLLNETNIIKPTSYLIRKAEHTYNVPSGELKSFLRKASPPVSLVGVFMPQAEGKALSAITPDLQDLSFIGQESLNTLKSLYRRKFVHSDIKPDNIIFDPVSRKLKFIDTGLLQKLSKSNDKPQYSRADWGTPNFSHPNVLRKKPYGCEVDLFSLAFTLLAIRYPRSQNIIGTERMHRGPGKESVPEWHKSWEVPGGQYLKRCVAAASKAPYIDAPSLAQLRSIQIALDKPKTEEGVFLDFVSKAIDVSFAKPEKYEAELEKLSQHPFLTSYQAHS